MSTRFPATGIDDSSTLPNPATTDKRNSPSHAGLHSIANDAIKAIETKIGTGSSTPTANTFLFGTGTGTSAWTQATSAQMAAAVSDETGSGSLVFATTPTLVTPKVDTINESTPGNGVTVAGMNVKSGVLSSPTTAIGTGGITAALLATSAITLGYAQLTASSPTTTSATATLVTSLTSTVTIPAGGRKVRIIAHIPNTSNASISTVTYSIWDGTVGSGTQLADSKYTHPIASTTRTPILVQAVVTPSVGSKTYNVGFAVDVGTETCNTSTTSPAFILVEAI